MTYEIRIKGHLATITLEDNGDTLLTGKILDQAELYGVLRLVRDLGTPLISVNRIETDNT